MNYSVHAVMYFYYFLVAIGMRPRWARFVTTFQLCQVRNNFFMPRFIGWSTRCRWSLVSQSAVSTFTIRWKVSSATSIQKISSGLFWCTRVILHYFSNSTWTGTSSASERRCRAIWLWNYQLSKAFDQRRCAWMVVFYSPEYMHLKVWVVTRLPPKFSD